MGVYAQPPMTCVYGVPPRFLPASVWEERQNRRVDNYLADCVVALRAGQPHPQPPRPVVWLHDRDFDRENGLLTEYESLLRELKQLKEAVD